VNKKVEVVLSPYLTLILLYLDIHWTASFCLLHEALAAHLNTSASEDEALPAHTAQRAARQGASQVLPLSPAPTS